MLSPQRGSRPGFHRSSYTRFNRRDLFLDFSFCIVGIKVFIFYLSEYFEFQICFLSSSSQSHAESFENHPQQLFLEPKCTKFGKKSKSTCKKSIQIHYKSSQIQSEAPTTSSHMPPSFHRPPHRHVWRGGGCFTLDFWRFPVDLDGFLACGFAVISLLSTRHIQKTSPSEPGSFYFSPEITSCLFRQVYFFLNQNLLSFKQIRTFFRRVCAFTNSFVGMKEPNTIPIKSIYWFLCRTFLVGSFGCPDLSEQL